MNYAGFISYTWDDQAAARALHAALERYTVPRSLRRASPATPKGARHLGHFFLDRADLRASDRLTDEIVSALEQSCYLIVVCSPYSAIKDWVLREIEVFQDLGRGRDIVPILVAGEPVRHDPVTAPQGAFPPLLLHPLGGDVPLAPDFRGANLDELQAGAVGEPLLQVIARLLDVPKATLTERHLEQERQRRSTRNRVIAALSVLLVLTAIGGLTAWQQKRTADARFAQALASATRQVAMAVELEDRYGVPTSVPRELYDGAARDFSKLAEEAGDVPRLVIERVRFHRSLGRLASVVEGSVTDADVARHLEMARADLDALDRRAAVWRVAPPPAERLAERIELLLLQAHLESAAGEHDAARAAADEALTHAGELERLAAASEPAAIDGLCTLGDVLYFVGDVHGAREQYRLCTGRAGEAARARPTTDSQRRHVDGLLRYGNILRVDEETREESRSLLQTAEREADVLLEAEEARSVADRMMWIEAKALLADTLDTLREPPQEALDLYEAALEELDDLIRHDRNRLDLERTRAALLYRMSGLRLRCASEGTCVAKEVHASLSEARQAAEAVERLADAQGDDVQLRRELAAHLSYLGMATAYFAMRPDADPALPDRAREAVDRALEIWTADGVADFAALNGRAIAHVNAGRAREMLGEDPIDHYATARGMFRRLIGMPEAGTDTMRSLALIDYLEARTLAARALWRPACQLIRRGISIMRPIADGDAALEQDLNDARALRDEQCANEWKEIER